jgi:hypothetical protein
MKKSGWSNKTKSLRKVGKVMHEFKEGELHVGKSDKIVKNPKQAIAIALSEAGLSKKATGGGVGEIEYKIGDIFEGNPNANYEESWQLFKPLKSYVINNKTNKIVSIHKTPYEAIEKRNSLDSNFKVHYEVKPKEYYNKMKTGGGVDGWENLSNVKPNNIEISETSAFGNPDKLILKYDGKQIAKFYYNMRGYNSDFSLKNSEGLYYGFGGDKPKSKQVSEFKKALKEGFTFIKGSKYKNGGGIDEEGIDLFEDYENIPENVQNILDKYEDGFMDGDYQKLEKAHKELEKIGYTFEYGLDGGAYDLRPIGTKGKSEVEEYKNGGGVGSEVYIEFLNKDKGYKKDVKNFKSYEEAVKWGRNNFDNFNSDMIHYKMANGGGLGESENNFQQINGNNYFTYNFENKGNRWTVLIAWGKYNHVNVTKKTNNPFGNKLGNEFDTIGEAVDNYKDVNIKSNILFAASMAKEYGYEPKYSEGGSIEMEEIDINELDMPIIRSQFEEEEFEFGNGGGIYSRTMKTPNGNIMGKVQYNDFWKTYQVVIDGVVYEEFKTKEEAIENLKNAGFDKMALGGKVGEEINRIKKHVVKVEKIKDSANSSAIKIYFDDDSISVIQPASNIYKRVYDISKYSDSQAKDITRLYENHTHFTTLWDIFEPMTTKNNKMALGGGVEDQSFDYMMLDRLRSDNDYYLGYGNRSERNLWAGNVNDQIDEMKRIWNKLKVKPEWLSLEDILEYERKMKNNYANGGGIPNNYLGKSADEVWSDWTETQRMHFLLDHQIFELHPSKVMISFKELPPKVRVELIQHISEGQYAEGGGIDLNDWNMPVIRTQFEDEEYEYAEGGEVTANEKMKSLKNYPKLKF